MIRGWYRAVVFVLMVLAFALMLRGPAQADGVAPSESQTFGKGTDWSSNPALDSAAPVVSGDLPETPLTLSGDYPAYQPDPDKSDGAVAVPEPSALIMLAMGIAGAAGLLLAAWRRTEA